jgi:hypothetical protein
MKKINRLAELHDLLRNGNADKVGDYQHHNKRPAS